LLKALSWKSLVIVLHDLVMTAVAVVAAIMLRFNEAEQAERFQYLTGLLPAFVAYAGLIYLFFGLYRSKWRFASIADLLAIARSVATLAITAMVIDYILVGREFYGFYFFGRQTILIYALLQMALLGGPRMAYRAWKDSRRRSSNAASPAASALLVGRSNEAEFALRAIESGALTGLAVRAILSPRASDIGQFLRGIQVAGSPADLGEVVADLAAQDITIRRLIVMPSALAHESEPDKLFQSARKLGLALSSLQSVDGEAARIAPLAIEDLLLRPSVAIDMPRLAGLIKGKRVAITGGGGSIGAEVCRKVAGFGARALLVLENSEPALFAITEQLQAETPRLEVIGHICDVRDRARLRALFEDFRPDFVFHAAALKHVPYLEQDWGEGIRTNVNGSINAADAALEAGAEAFVMISTDKAIEPVSMLGATKRFAEIYTEALDEELRRRDAATRMISVRFGNVLGSNGSVVPKFKAQIERGGPLTVTHPDMVRYFMTVSEAADLVLTAATHAKDPAASKRASTYVLQMGQPVRILDLAERMVRLSGLEPGVDIEIRFSGVRPGERLHEILFAKDETKVDIGVEGVLAAQTVGASLATIAGWVKRLDAAVAARDRAAAEAVFKQAIPTFAVSAPPLPAPEAPRASAGSA